MESNPCLVMFMAIFILVNDDCIIYEYEKVCLKMFYKLFAYTTSLTLTFDSFDSSKNKGSLMVDYKFEKMKTCMRKIVTRTLLNLVKVSFC